jgi:hypothetical protein
MMQAQVLQVRYCMMLSVVLQEQRRLGRRQFILHGGRTSSAAETQEQTWGPEYLQKSSANTLLAS